MTQNVVEQVPLITRIVSETMTRVPSYVDPADLATAGLTALVLATDAFDADHDVSFDQFAEARVRRAIADQLSSTDWSARMLSVPETDEQLTLLSRAIADLPGQLRPVVELYFLAGRPVTRIAETLGLTRARVAELRAEALVLLSSGRHTDGGIYGSVRMTS